MSPGAALPLRFKPPTEGQVQATLCRLFAAAGWKVGSTSQYRASGQVVGLPDLLLRHVGLRRFAWWETKAPRGRWRDRPDDPWTYFTPYDRQTWRSKALRPKQEEFMTDALLCGELYGWGGLVEAEEFLIGRDQGVRLANGLFQLVGRVNYDRSRAGWNYWPIYDDTSDELLETTWSRDEERR